MISWHITFVICFIRVSQPPAPNPSLISVHQKSSQLTAHSSQFTAHSSQLREGSRERGSWLDLRKDQQQTSKMSISPLRSRGAKLHIAFGAIN